MIPPKNKCLMRRSERECARSDNNKPEVNAAIRIPEGHRDISN